MGDLYSDDLLRLAEGDTRPDFDDTAFFDAAGMVYNAGRFDASMLNTPEARKMMGKIEGTEYAAFPVCIAKTQFSFSTDPKLYCVAKGFDFNVRDIVINAGAEMIVAIAGNIMRMPGLPKVPAAMHIDIVNGQIEGLS